MFRGSDPLEVMRRTGESLVLVLIAFSISSSGDSMNYVPKFFLMYNLTDFLN